MTTSPPAETAPAPLFTELSARRLGPVRRFFVRHPVAMDVVVILVYLLSAVSATAAPPGMLMESGVAEDDASVTRLLVAGLVATLGGAVLLIWRRRRPVLVTAAMAVLAVGCLVTSGSIVGLDFGLALALYAVAASRPPAITWLTWVPTMTVTGVAIWFWETYNSDGSLVMADPDSADPFDPLSTPQVRLLAVFAMVIMSLLAVAIGTSVRNRRLHVADLVDRTNALARDRDQQTQLARAAERTRIAREMHDVVAHSLSVMIALADGAQAALDRAPDRSRHALDELSETGRSALADMRRVLGVLHESDAPLEPQPGSLDLVELVERFRTAGMPLRTNGLSTPLPDDTGLQLAVYRIVSEALTNALRHAPGTTQVDLTLRRDDRSVEIEVVDHGAGVPVGDPGGAGQGLIGMRERVAVYSGTVEAGPWKDGWRVCATLPWDGEGR